MPADPACEVFLEFSRRKLLEQYWPRLRKAVEPPQRRANLVASQ